MKRSWILPAVLLLATAGCGDDDKKDSGSEPTETATTATYVSQVNTLCDALIDEVVPITGDSAPIPSRKRYLSNTEQLAPVYAPFDDAVAEVPAVTEADESAKAAFDAYLAALAQMDADLTAQADTLSNAEWTPVVEKAYDDLFTSPERQAMIAAGINCPAR